jgi:hypothetical protein
MCNISYKKRDLKDFRGQTGGIGTSFADNLTIDFRDELNTKGRLLAKIFLLPLVHKIFNG